MIPPAAWILWLARTNYGIDYNADIDPPCTLRELAEAYHWLDTDPTPTTVEQWEWCITENTGAFAHLEGRTCLWAGCRRDALTGSNRCVTHTPLSPGDAHRHRDDCTCAECHIAATGGGR